jgi:hypothetical protein
VGVVEGGSGPGLGKKSPAPLGVIGQLGGQELDGGLPLQPGIFGQKDLTHAPRAKSGGNATMPDSPADHGL